MEIYIERNQETLNKEFTGSASALLEELAIVPEDILLIRNGALITEEEELTNDDKIQLLSVISGG